MTVFPGTDLPSIWAPGGGALPIFKAHLFVARFLGRQLQEPDGASDSIPPSMEMDPSGWSVEVEVESGFTVFFFFGWFPWSWFFSGKCRCFLVFLVWVFCNVFFFLHVFGGWPGKKNSFCQLFGQFLGVFSCWGGKIDE